MSYPDQAGQSAVPGSFFDMRLVSCENNKVIIGLIIYDSSSFGIH